MVKHVQMFRLDEVQSAAYLGPEGEVVVDTGDNTLRVHDGSTPGGFKTARNDQVLLQSNNLSDVDDAAEARENLGIRDNTGEFAIAGGTADALTVAFTPPFLAFEDGEEIRVRALLANTTTTPNIVVDALAALDIVKFGGLALAVGDIAGVNHEMTLRYNLGSNRLELLNPRNVQVTAGKKFAATNSLTLAGTDGTTMTFPTTNATLARTDAANTFAGQQVFSGSVKVDIITGSGAIAVSTSGITAGGVVMSFNGSDSTYKASICDMDAGGANNAPTAFQVQKTSSSGRSISAAGTINASGADYAEYETKNDNCPALQKGQIVGFDVDGKLTDKWSEALSFAIKSTDPSYCGGDVWGSEEALGMAKPFPPVVPEIPADLTDRDAVRLYNSQVDVYNADLETYPERLELFEAKLEANRQNVDRIAYSGKVPVNLGYAAQVGDYIIVEPDANDGIISQAVLEPTFEQYRRAVGRVRKIVDANVAIVAVIIH